MSVEVDLAFVLAKVTRGHVRNFKMAIGKNQAFVHWLVVFEPSDIELVASSATHDLAGRAKNAFGIFSGAVVDKGGA